MIAERPQQPHRPRPALLPTLALTFALVLALAAVPAAHAQECNIGTGLASTLLIPYFEVDPTDPNGITTIFTIVNESPTQPTMARVVLWTDWGIPTLSFDVYLTALDLQSFNLRDQFNGNVPSTGDGADLSGFEFCGGLPPFHANPALTADERAQLVADHRGQVGPLEAQCAGENHGDSLLRGYVTIDTVDECSGIQLDETFTPADDGYFADGGDGEFAIAVAQNRLWGDFTIVDPANDSAQGSEAVALWADPGRFTDDPTFTFYGRYTGYDGSDERVPVPSLWNSRFLNGGIFSGGTDLLVWRDTGSADVSRVPCFGADPSWYPLQTSFITARDEEAENPVFLTESTAFPLATQRVPTSAFAFPYAFGRIQLGLADGPGLSNQRQAWVQTILSANDRFSVGQNARAINELCDQAP